MNGVGPFKTFGTGRHNFGYVPDPPEPTSDAWYETHCPKCKHNREWEENGKNYGECTAPYGACEFEEIDED